MNVTTRHAQHALSATGRATLKGPVAERSANVVRSTAEAAWWQSAAEATGAFSPLAGPTSEVIVGTISALAARGLDIEGMVPGHPGKIYKAQDADGFVWFVRWLGAPFWKAFRDRSDYEVAAEIEATDDLMTRHLRTSTLMALRCIASELVQLGESLRPEACPTRSQRKAMKERILDLAKMQMDLAYYDPPGRSTRARMAALGLEVPRINRVGRLDALH